MIVFEFHHLATAEYNGTYEVGEASMVHLGFVEMIRKLSLKSDCN